LLWGVNLAETPLIHGLLQKRNMALCGMRVVKAHFHDKDIAFKKKW